MVSEEEIQDTDSRITIKVNQPAEACIILISSIVL